MRVPFLDLAAQLETTQPDIERAVLDVIASGRYIGGPVLDAFERAMADYVGVDHAIGVSSGTDALLVSLMALDVGPGDLVVTSPYSFFATAGAVARLGATPVFVDIDPRTFNIDPACLYDWFKREPERRTRVKAIVPVHLFGQCADMAPILELAAEHGIPVVEDAAQALGARYPGGAGNGDGHAGGNGGGSRSVEGGGRRNRPAGSMGDACLLLLLSHQEPGRHGRRRARGYLRCRSGGTSAQAPQPRRACCVPAPRSRGQLPPGTPCRRLSLPPSSGILTDGTPGAASEPRTTTGNWRFRASSCPWPPGAVSATRIIST